ncbi:hypothetical protein [Chryseolinea lacunae]|uniref:Outer membrane protein beta-barrel domain-containing protein n=1 Tax=Chryseolinea lacunae TaxID=2801331 RepID=A0ABS1KXC7_9BACT|nr:hypothetical protein [Chryseolinea lacunae]MBL0744123.1 hypothetical protein [Chryseolinea lacunae]
MKKYFTSTFFFLCAVTLSAQHSSEDFKDAAGCGPFPLYIGLGYATSRYNDVGTVGEQFLAKYGPGKVKHNLRGANAVFGTTIIPTKWTKPVSFLLEGKYLWLTRETQGVNSSFNMISSQLSLGGGFRYAAFPFVLQAQYQRILFSRQDFDFNLDGVRKAIDVSSGGNMVLLRLSFLDPAGSDGGFGVFIEYGAVFLDQRKNGQQLTTVINTFNETFNEPVDCTGNYRFLSFGILVPLALRLK